MGLDFTKIKDLFVESSGDDKGSDKKENKTPVKETKDTKKQPPSVNKPTVKITASGQVDQKIFDSLIKVLEEKNLPGEDYMEFMDAYQAMKNIQLDDNIKIQTVLATLSTKGLTVKKIFDSADYYIAELNKEKDKFDNALGQQVNLKVESKHNEVKRLNEEIKSKSDQIAKLTTEINNHQKNIQNINQQIIEAESKIKATESNFSTTFEFIISQIQGNIDKIKQLDQKKG